MLLQSLGEVLPSALAVALSPFPVIAVILVLGSPRGKSSGPAFAFGWMLGLAVLATIVVLVAGDADDPESAAATGVGWTELILGVGLLVLAGRKWRSRPKAGDEVAMPGWMAGMERVSPGRAFVLGAALGGANPKNVALTFAASAAIAESGVEGVDLVVALGLFVVLGSITVLGAVLAHVLLGERAVAGLAAVKEFMTANNAVIMMVLLLIFGAKLVGDGLAGLGV
jgi:threonine/homoserine/homoserine lactone efflux protein